MRQATQSVIRDSVSLLIWVLLMLLGCVLFFFSLDRQIVSILKTTLMAEQWITSHLLPEPTT